MAFCQPKTCTRCNGYGIILNYFDLTTRQCHECNGNGTMEIMLLPKKDEQHVD